MLTLFALTSCDDNFVDPNYLTAFYNEGLHKVSFDSVTAVSGVSEGDTLHLRFWGFVGPNWCHSFVGLVATRDSFRLDVTGWAYDSRAELCAPAIRRFRDEPLDVFPVFAGKLLIVMHQPRGPALTDTITVLPAGKALRPSPRNSKLSHAR
jgi:hypothetical protein